MKTAPTVGREKYILSNISKVNGVRKQMVTTKFSCTESSDMLSVYYVL